MRPDDICPRPGDLPPSPTVPHAAPIYPTSVWECESPEQASQLLSGQARGFVYQRDGHPNAELFTQKCNELHGAERTAVTSSGMAALVAALLSQVQAGDHVVASSFLYGRSLLLLGAESARLGITHSLADTCDLQATAAAMTDRTKLLVVETIANPRLQVANIAALADIAHRRGAKLLVDNTFATPILCRPLDLGADLVMESVSKMMNGHSDVMLGALSGRAADWQRVPLVLSAWALASSPFDAWLATRGLATLHLRMERACENAQRAAEFLIRCTGVEKVDYPGLSTHPDHALAAKQFGNRFGSVVTFQLDGGRAAAELFMNRAKNIPFCPSLGEVSTTLSHPESTSHRGMTPEKRASLGITGGTIRLSLGVESAGYILESLRQGLGI